MSRAGFFGTVAHPVSEDKKQLLAERWQELPPDLRVGWQVVGQQIAHCGFTLAASYCSFGCTHCYLPSNANLVPIPSLESMKRQIDANRGALGELGALQVTGGDVLDAYWKADRSEELVELLRYSMEVGLVPMLMTHGQLLLDEPAYFDRLVTRGGLRRVAIHIDMTQAGRPGFPIGNVSSEADLHPLRDSFVDALEGVRRRTGKRVSAAHTVTVTQKNVDSLGEIVDWFRADRRNARAFRMLSVQTEAAVGRTRMSSSPVTAQEVWRGLGEAFEVELPSGSLWFGDPECSSMVSLALCFAARRARREKPARVISLIGDDDASRRFLTEMLATFGGVGSRGSSWWDATARRLGLLLRRPGFVHELLRYLATLRREKGLGVGFLLSLLSGRVVGLNLVQHNFMDEEMVRRGGAEVERRLAACSFRGAIEREGKWVDVPMCSLNGQEREQIYDLQIRDAQTAEAGRSGHLKS